MSIINDQSMPTSKRVLRYMRKLRDKQLTDTEKQDAWKKIEMSDAEYDKLWKDIKDAGGSVKRGPTSDDGRRT